MRVAFIFVFSFCLLLLTGSCYGITPCKKTDTNRSTQSIVKTHHDFAEYASYGLSLRKNTNVNENREDFISVEDDDDLVITRKLVAPTKYTLIPDYSSLVVIFYSYSKSRLPFCKHLSYTSSYKYILQRVLRI